VGCVVGAFAEHSYLEKWARVDFEAIGVEPTRVYRVEDAQHFPAVGRIAMTPCPPRSTIGA
jgi:hypothetical protein